MKRVYFAKSNNASPHLVERVRSYLKTLPIEIVEYKGATKYNHDDLLSCDYLLVLPESSNRSSGRPMKIGKGLYGQIDVFNKKLNSGWSGRAERLQIVVDVANIGNNQRGNSLRTAEFFSMSITDETDWTNHADLTFDKMTERNFADLFSTKDYVDANVKSYDDVKVDFENYLDNLTTSSHNSPTVGCNTTNVATQKSSAKIIDTMKLEQVLSGGSTIEYPASTIIKFGGEKINGLPKEYLLISLL
jgi:hypothetical protein